MKKGLIVALTLLTLGSVNVATETIESPTVVQAAKHHHRHVHKKQTGHKKKKKSQHKKHHAKAHKIKKAAKKRPRKKTAKKRRKPQLRHTKIKKLHATNYHLIKGGAKQPLVNLTGTAKKTGKQKVVIAKNRSITWRRFAKTTLVKGKHRTVYYQLQNGNQRVWAAAKYLKKGLVAPAGKVIYQGSSNGVAQYAAPHKVLDPIWHQDFKLLTLPGNGSYSTNLKSNDFKRSAAYSRHLLQNTPDTLGIAKAVGDHYSFRTAAYLPVSYDHSGDMSNPQSATFSADDQTLFVMYTESRAEDDTASNTGHVVRYDWGALKQLGMSDSGRMEIIRKASLDHLHNRETSFDQQVLSHIHVGSSFATGHGQSMALNPQTNEIWFTQDMTPGKSVVERLNTSTLRPDARLAFSLKSGVGMGSVLTFDNAGHAYFWKKKNQSNWKNTPTGSVKIYKGTLSTKRVHFSTVLQGLRTAPGYFVQSISYNPANGRLYLISDESITSLPANKLGHLKASDIGQINFNGKREFEGLVFEHHGNTGFLLANRGPELMRLEN